METNINSANTSQSLPQTNQVPNQPIVEPQTNKLVKVLLYAIGAIVFMAIGAFGYGYIQKNKEVTITPVTNVPTQTQPTQQAQPTSVVQPTVLSNLKTYTNSKLNYTIQLPNNWDIEGEGSFLNIPGEATFLPPGEKSKEGYRTVIAITTMTTGKVRYSLNTQEQFDEWLTKPISNGTGERLYKIGNIKVDGINAIQVVSRALPGDQTEAFYSIITWFRKDNANYYIEFGGMEELINNNRSVYDQVISSFKFVKQTKQSVKKIKKIRRIDKYQLYVDVDAVLFYLIRKYGITKQIVS